MCFRFLFLIGTIPLLIGCGKSSEQQATDDTPGQIFSVWFEYLPGPIQNFPDDIYMPTDIAMDIYKHQGTRYKYLFVPCQFSPETKNSSHEYRIAPPTKQRPQNPGSPFLNAGSVILFCFRSDHAIEDSIFCVVGSPLRRDYYWHMAVRPESVVITRDQNQVTAKLYGLQQYKTSLAVEIADPIEIDLTQKFNVKINKISYEAIPLTSPYLSERLYSDEYKAYHDMYLSYFLARYVRAREFHRMMSVVLCDGSASLGGPPATLPEWWESICAPPSQDSSWRPLE